jgi:hypothetical protein
MADRSIYARLKRLFSTGVIVRQVGGKKLKVADTDNVQSFMSNAMRDRYARVHAASGYSSMTGQYGLNMAYQTQRITLFRDYDVMDNDPIIASALDIYAQESTTKNEYGDILDIQSDDGHVKDILHNLFYDILNLEFNLPMWVRNLCKYGDFFLFLEISPEYGIHNVMPLSVYDTIRIEGEKPENPYYVRYETLGMNGYKQSFENYELAHFRLLSDANFVPYGKSQIEPARRIFRQLTLMEDAMMIHRIMRAPEKRVYKIDVGNIPPNEIDSYIQRMMDKAKKVPFIDPATGDYNLRYNMQNIIEDFWLPVRGKDHGNSIENLGGLEYNSIEDIDYLKNKLMSALKIPKAFLGYDEAVSGKATLAAEDVRFAKTIEWMQRIVVSELTKIAIIHLYAQGFTDEALVNFSLRLTTPSTIFEQEKINLWTQKAGLIAQLQGTKMLSEEWMYKNLFSMPEDEIEEQRDRLVEEAKQRFRILSIEQGASDPAKFGFPQDQSPEENAAQQGPEGAGGAGAPGAPGAGAIPANMPKSVDELPTAEELGLEEEVDEETRGRPRKGAVYAQDSHVRGRDPLGFKSRYTDLQLSNQRKTKSPLSLEVKNTLTKMRENKKVRILTEEMIDQMDKIVESANLPDISIDLTRPIVENRSEDEGTYLDENNILRNNQNDE